jgi:hypothetical protein
MTPETSIITEQLTLKGFVSLKRIMAKISEDFSVPEITSSAAEDGLVSLLTAFKELAKWEIIGPRFTTAKDEKIYNMALELFINSVSLSVLARGDDDFLETFIDTKWWILGTALPLLETGNIPVSAFERKAYDQIVYPRTAMEGSIDPCPD